MAPHRIPPNAPHFERVATMFTKTDVAAGGTAVSAVAWAPSVAQINEYLTTISLVGGIAFLAWRWWRAAQLGKDPES